MGKRVNMNEDIILDAISKIRGSDCLLCGNPSVYAGVFVPEPGQKIVGEPVGKRRLGVYGICANHVGHEEEIEAKLAAEGLCIELDRRFFA